MTQPLATYSFLPYLRIGLPNRITQPDQDPVKLRATFDLALALEGQGVAGGTVADSVTKSIQLYGPGDIVGIESRAFFKTEPLHWITNFEANYLPYIDFYEEDFPWRYTPAKADEPAHRLRPWIALVVLEPGEFADGTDLKDKPLPFIEVATAATAFPPAEQLWAWAHTHVNQDLAASDAEIVSTDMNAVLPRLQSALGGNADIAYSRLLCPRKLKPNTAYHAFLIPSFESGRQAGLGADVAPAFATQYAWGASADPTSFPYYHRWYFQTGSVGDFEYLVRLLQAKPADERVGRRDMDMQSPGWNLPGLDAAGPLGGILKLGGALRVPIEVIKDVATFNKYEHWAEVGYPQPIQKAIAGFLNLADDYQQDGPNPQPIPDPDDAVDPDPLIVPPLYGRWHAGVQRLLTDAAGADLPNTTNWIHELNLDPRFRMPAGFGTRVVQDKQEELMNAAWQQIGDVLKANHFIRLAQLSSETLWQWHTTALQPLAATQPERTLTLTAPVQRRVLVDNLTVASRVAISRVPAVMVSAPMRRIMRPGARTVTQLPFATRGIAVDALIGRLNAGEIVPAPVKATPPAIVTEQVLADQVQPPVGPPWLADLVRRDPWLPDVLLVLALLLALLVVVLAPGALLLALAVAAVAGLVALALRMWRVAAAQAVPPVFTPEGQVPAAIASAPLSPDFRITAAGDTFRPTAGTSDSVEAIRFKAALSDVFTVDVAARAAAVQPVRQALDLKVLANQTVAALHPDVTLARLVLDRLLLPARFLATFNPQRFDEIMNYPQFDLAMYKPLADLSSEYFLPNINLIEQNSITLLETNQKFIESYMVGLNHEMARELLWREYPTDQRGSYFRQFWDVSAYLPDPGEDLATLKERLRDIPEIHRWLPTSALGDHDNREVGGAKEEELVLVVRGELLKKYPTAVIYAHKAQWQTKKRPDGSDTGEIDNTKERELADIPVGQEDQPPRSIVKTPLYGAKVDPDIFFYGFDLTAEVAKGSDGSHPGDKDNPGWFLVIKERPGEPRFGLDIGGPSAIKHTWSDLSWGDVTPAVADGAHLQVTAATAPIALRAPTDTSEAEYAEELEQFGEDSKVAWNPQSDAADLAYILYQVPVLVAVHASEMLTVK